MIAHLLQHPVDLDCVISHVSLTVMELLQNLLQHQPLCGLYAPVERFFHAQRCMTKPGPPRARRSVSDAALLLPVSHSGFLQAHLSAFVASEACLHLQHNVDSPFQSILTTRTTICASLTAEEADCPAQQTFVCPTVKVIYTHGCGIRS